MASQIPNMPKGNKGAHLSKKSAESGIYGKGGLTKKTKGGLIGAK